jgi:hypothetical protein
MAPICRFRVQARTCREGDQIPFFSDAKPIRGSEDARLVGELVVVRQMFCTTKLRNMVLMWKEPRVR